MPIVVADSAWTPPANEEYYAIFYSSIDETGKMWCPDCRAVDETVNKTFKDENGPKLAILYVGQRHEWKLPAQHKYRGKDSFNVNNVPTLIKFKEGKQVARLSDDQQILDSGKLREFLSL